MELTETLLESKEIFAGKLLHVYEDTVRLPNGQSSTREIVRHQGGACVCAIDEEMNVSFVRQFRFAYGMETLELPAGKIEKGEEAYSTAIRELKEEAGLMAEDILPMGEMLPSPGYTDEIVHLFLAINAQPCEQELDHDEFINVEKIYIGDALNMVLKGEIRDAKTQICLLKSFLVLENLGSQYTEEMGDGSVQ